MPDSFAREHFASQELVFRRGDLGEAAYVIEDGCVEVLAGSLEQPRRVALLTQGAMFGEVALLDRQPRTATVRALVPTRLLRIDRSHVKQLLDRTDPVIQFLVDLLLKRFRSNHDSALPASDRSEIVSEGEPTPDLHRSAVRMLSLAQDLSGAIDQGQLILYYQPLVTLPSLELAGFEALVRWQHPVLGLISPAEFIPLAERTGLSLSIGHWVVRRAAADWQCLRDLCAPAERESAFVAINLAAPDVATPAIVEFIEHALAQHAMPARALRVELTESCVIDHVDTVAATLRQLRNLGCGVALDDFGTGYAGLDYLQSLPFTCLKIDRVFIQNLEHSSRSEHIVRAALELARSLGLSSVAEGVEAPGMAEHVARQGCTHAQGFLYGKPMPLAALAAWRDTHRQRYGLIEPAP